MASFSDILSLHQASAGSSNGIAAKKQERQRITLSLTQPSPLAFPHPPSPSLRRTSPALSLRRERERKKRAFAFSRPFSSFFIQCGSMHYQTTYISDGCPIKKLHYINADGLGLDTPPHWCSLKRNRNKPNQQNLICKPETRLSPRLLSAVYSSPGQPALPKAAS